MNGFGLALSLARRELRGGAAGFRVLVACLFLGVATVAAIGSLSQALLEGLARDGRALLGGDIDLRLVHREAGEAEASWLNERHLVSQTAQMRTMLRPDEGQDQLLVELKSVDDLYPLYGKVEFLPPGELSEALAEKDGRWGVLVESGVLARLGLAPGDHVRIGEAQFRIEGELRREPDRLTRGLTFGPGVMVSRRAFDAAGLLQPGSLVRFHYRLKLDEGVGIAQAREELDDAFPEAGWRITDARRASPRVSRFLERVRLYLILVGLSALLIGGLGVGNATRAYLATKTTTIATLKCLGASARLIFATYLLQVMALALPAVVGGTIFGALVPFGLDFFLGDALGWRGAPGPYLSPLGMAGIFGFLVAGTFALWPLLEGIAVSPASLFRSHLVPTHFRPGFRGRVTLLLLGLALAVLALIGAGDIRIGGVFVFGALIALVLFHYAGKATSAWAKRGGARRYPLLRLARTNLHRPGAATGTVLLSLGLGLTLLSAIVLIEANLDRQLNQVLPEKAPSFYFIDIPKDEGENFEQLIEAFPGVEDLQRVPMLRGRISAINGKRPEELVIPKHVGWVFRGDRGLTWTAEPVRGAELTAGDWWPEDYSGPPLVSLDDEVGRALGIGPGDSLTINLLGRDFTTEIANLRKIEWEGLSINFIMIFSPGLLENAPQTQLATLRIPENKEADLERRIAERFPMVSAVRVREALAEVTSLMGRIALAVKMVAGVALFTGALVLIGAVGADQQRRSYDSVVLKVLGATRGHLLAAHLLEQGLLTLISAVIAAALGTFAAYLVLVKVLHSSFVFLPLPLLTTLLVTGGLTLVFGFAATFRSLGKRPARFLRNH